MRCGFLYDTLEIAGLDVAVSVTVEMQESLSYPLTLQPSQHLRELGVRHGMPVLLAAEVEGGPVGVPVEGDGVGGLVAGVEFFEGGKVDVAGNGVGEEAEGDVVFGVRLQEEIIEDVPVGEGDAAAAGCVGNGEEEGVLLAVDFVLVMSVWHSHTSLLRGCQCQLSSHPSTPPPTSPPPPPLTHSLIHLTHHRNHGGTAHSTYIVFSHRRHRIHKLLLAHILLARRLIRHRMQQEITARLRRELRESFIVVAVGGGAEDRVLEGFGDRRHGREAVALQRGRGGGGMR